MPDNSTENDLLTSTQERARQLREALRRQESELSDDHLLEPAVREAGLKAVRCAAQCADRLQALAEQAMGSGAGRQQTKRKKTADSPDRGPAQ